MNKLRVAVLFGGESSEHEVSRRSVCSILAHLNPEKYDVTCIGITKTGVWQLYTGSRDAIMDGAWENDPTNRLCMISSNAAIKGILLPDSGEVLPVDVIFPVLHGKNGEDGTVQGLFELAGIPYVGCGVLASSACMDKAVTNMLLDYNGIPKAKFVWCYTDDYLENPAPVEAQIAEKLGYPVFVKPANAGSSVGVSKVSAPEDLYEAMKVAGKEDGRIVIEEAIVGREVECAVLGNRKPIASVIGEVLTDVEFYTYDAKYKDPDSKTAIPANLDADIVEKIRTTAVEAYRMLGCTGLSRVDFFVRNSDNAILLNELNTLPGFTSISMYPKLFEASGIGTVELLDRLIELALERAA